jgi:hypothetical protein
LVKKPGSAGLFHFYIVPLARDPEQFPFVRCFAFDDSAVCRLRAQRSPGRKTIGLMAATDRAGFGNSNRDDAAPSGHPFRVTLFRRSKKNALA